MVVYKMINQKPEELSPLVLAYMGDSVYELFVREKVIENNPNLAAHKLHIEAIKYVSAPAQSKSCQTVCLMLDEKEEAVFKRGRNAKSHTAAKNASITDYRRATGLEALFGYLYLKGETHRLYELMDAAFKSAK